MATLTIQVNSELAPFTTQMRRLDKGVEQFYYALLFIGEAKYSASSDAWRSWLRMGFHVGSKGSPPAAVKADRLGISVRPDGKLTHITVSSSNSQALQKLQDLLQAIERLRGSLKGKDDAARLRILEDNAFVMQQLTAPVGKALKSGAFRPDEVASVQSMIKRGLAALADDEITAIAFTPG